MAPLSSVPELDEAVARLPLIDHHCHSVVRSVGGREAFEDLISEGETSPGHGTGFDSTLGLSIRRWCAPVLDLPPHAAAEDYLHRRSELGDEEAGRRLLRATGTAALLVDTGFRPAELLTTAELAQLAGAPAREVVRLEALVEQVASEGAGAGELGDAVDAAVSEAATSAVAFKSIAAYRIGLAFDPEPPGGDEVARASEAWLATPAQGPARLDDPVLIRHALWAAAGTGLPLQFHTGFGDADAVLRRSNPILLAPFCRAAPAPVVLLHCYPYQREAAWLCHVLPNAYFDLGLASAYAGPRATALLAEALEVAPFGKLLYSSDAFGLPELYLLGALRFRQACVAVLGELAAAGELTVTDATRLAGGFAAGNARQLYGLAV